MPGRKQSSGAFLAINGRARLRGRGGGTLAGAVDNLWINWVFSFGSAALRLHVGVVARAGPIYRKKITSIPSFSLDFPQMLRYVLSNRLDEVFSCVDRGLTLHRHNPLCDGDFSFGTLRFSVVYGGQLSRTKNEKAGQNGRPPQIIAGFCTDESL